MDKRLEILKNWLSTDLGIPITSIEPASADASFRRYFRVNIQQSIAVERELPSTFIVMDSPPEHENNEQFIKCAQALKQRDLNVPKIFNHDLSKGLILMNDLGIEIYQDKLTLKTADLLYTDALQALIKVQSPSPVNQNSLNFVPKYSKMKLLEEMQLFEDWYIGKYHQSQLNSNELENLQTTQKTLVDNALKQPQVLVHRDFHSRNLLFQDQNNPGIIDFQDMVFGPITYDLVSLLKDCYIQWPTEKVESWALEFQKLSISQDIHQVSDPTLWLKWFDLMGVQRHLKVLGIFSRLFFRDGKSQYLKDIPLTYHYLVEVCSNYPELKKIETILKKFPPREITSQ